MVRYRIDVGRDHGVQVKDIVGAIANEAGIESRFIGRIGLYDESSTVELPAGMPSRSRERAEAHPRPRRADQPAPGRRPRRWRPGAQLQEKEVRRRLMPLIRCAGRVAGRPRRLDHDSGHNASGAGIKAPPAPPRACPSAPGHGAAHGGCREAWRRCRVREWEIGRIRSTRPASR
jgi:hypothetical protein